MLHSGFDFFFSQNQSRPCWAPEWPRKPSLHEWEWRGEWSFIIGLYLIVFQRFITINNIANDTDYALKTLFIKPKVSRCDNLRSKYAYNIHWDMTGPVWLTDTLIARVGLASETLQHFGVICGLPVTNGKDWTMLPRRLFVDVGQCELRTVRCSCPGADHDIKITASL